MCQYELGTTKPLFEQLQLTQTKTDHISCRCKVYRTWRKPLKKSCAYVNMEGRMSLGFMVFLNKAWLPLEQRKAFK